LVESGGSVVESTEPIYEAGNDADEVPFVFTKAEVHGVNVLLRLLKPRLKNDGVRKILDPNNPDQYITVSCTVFTDAELTCFLINSLSEFNATPHFSQLGFDNPQIYTIFADIIVQGAALLALAAQALIERGREFTITDNGISFVPPAVSEMLQTQYSTQLTDYRTRLKEIKCQFKPRPLGLGTWVTTGTAPAFSRLRHLRERQLI
jgi:hypothetical protein